jgi:hypothetical protein
MSNSGSYFYRCYSDSSAGALISGKGHALGRPFGSVHLRAEFDNHIELRTKKCTALVSTSNRLIDTLRRAFSKVYNGHEDPTQVWVAFFCVPDIDRHVYHHAEDLAKRWNLSNPERLRYEYIFEWEIPKRYLIHKVSVKTLMERGLHMGGCLPDYTIPPTAELKEDFARIYLDPTNDGFFNGIALGNLAHYFGARAPVRQIAHQLVQDCVGYVDPNAQLVSVSYGNNVVKHIDFAFFRGMDDGIEIALIDWWLTDSNFANAYGDYCVWASQIEERLVTECEALYEALLDDEDASIERYEREKQRLREEHHQVVVEVENAAIDLGL